jgi:hypothetical protein
LVTICSLTGLLPLPFINVLNQSNINDIQEKQLEEKELEEE